MHEMMLPQWAVDQLAIEFAMMIYCPDSIRRRERNTTEIEARFVKRVEETYAGQPWDVFDGQEEPIK